MKYSIDMLGKTLTILGLIGTISIIVIMTFTNPSEAGPAGILSLFISIYIVVLSATTYALFFISQLLSRVLLKGSSSRAYALTLPRAYYYSSVLSLAPVLLIGMQSVTTVGVYEMGLVLMLIGLGCVYVARKLP